MTSITDNLPPAAHFQGTLPRRRWVLDIFAVLLLLCLNHGFARLLAAGETAPPAANAAAPAVVQGNRAFAENDLLELLTAALQQENVKDKGELELRLSQPWKTRSVPDEPLTLKVLDLPSLGVTSMFIARIELRAGGQSLGSWQLPVQAHVWREVWVAHSALQRGALVADADLSRERRDMLNVHEPLAEFAAGDTTLELAESVAASSPLLARAVKQRPVVRRGQLVDACIQDGALSISMKVEVLEDGVPGQMIRIRNTQSRHDIRGKVLNEQTILVAL